MNVASSAAIASMAIAPPITGGFGCADAEQQAAHEWGSSKGNGEARDDPGGYGSKTVEHDSGDHVAWPGGAN